MLGKHKHVTAMVDGKPLEFRPDQPVDRSPDPVPGYLILETGEHVRADVAKADLRDP